jgi:hypothetical protein
VFLKVDGCIMTRHDTDSPAIFFDDLLPGRQLYTFVQLQLLKSMYAKAVDYQDELTRLYK